MQEQPEYEEKVEVDPADNIKKVWRRYEGDRFFVEFRKEGQDAPN